MQILSHDIIDIILHSPDVSKIFQISDDIEKMHNGNQLKNNMFLDLHNHMHSILT